MTSVQRMVHKEQKWISIIKNIEISCHFDALIEMRVYLKMYNMWSSREQCYTVFHNVGREWGGGKQIHTMACSSTFMWLLELFSSFNGHEFNCTHLAACAVNRRQSLGNYVVITQRMPGSQHHRKPFFVIKKCESEPGCLPSAAVCVMTGFILYLILSLFPPLSFCA